MGIGSYRHRVTLEQPRPVPPVSSSMWRMLFSATNDLDGLVALRDLALAAEAGGPDLCTGGIASASSEWGELYTAAKAFDDPTDWSYWSSADAQPMPQWLAYTFPAPVQVREYRVQAEGESSDVPAYYAPLAWTFEYWDGTAWVVADAQTNQIDWMGGEIRTCALPVPAPEIWDCSIQSAASQVVDGLTPFFVRGRWHPQMSLETRILFEGRKLQVQSISDVDERHVEMILMCVEVVGRGRELATR